jgi:PAS domain S-box-containing protein
MMSAPPASDDIASTVPSEDNIRLLLDLLPDAVIVTTQAEVVFANPAAQRLFGAETGQEVQGHHALDLVDDRSLALAMMRLADPPATEQVFPYHLRRLNGDHFEAELTGRNIVFRDRPSRLLVIRDASEQSRARDQSRRDARQALKEQIARLRHKLSQPLNVIRLAAEGALLMIERDRIPADGWPESQFALIAEQSERTAQILDTLRIDEPDLSTSSAALPQPAGSHILVVENDPAAAAALSSYLSTQGCRVSLADSGRDAWDRFRNDPADVVITDLLVPTGDGEDLIAVLRDFDPLLPIIVTTARPGGADRLDARFRDERCVVLKKPPPLSEIARLIAAFLLPPSEEPFTSC